MIAQVNLVFAAHIPPKAMLLRVFLWAVGSCHLMMFSLCVLFSLVRFPCVNGYRKAELYVQFPMRAILLRSLCVIIGNNAKMEILFTFELMNINQKIAFDCANGLLAGRSSYLFRNRKCVHSFCCSQSISLIRWLLGKFRNLACDNFPLYLFSSKTAVASHISQKATRTKSNGR